MSEVAASIVAPLPTKAHWVPDAKAAFCAIPGCGRAFSLIERKHHCRRFGNLIGFFFFFFEIIWLKFNWRLNIKFIELIEFLF